MSHKSSSLLVYSLVATLVCVLQDMEERRVQYLVVDAPTAPWSDDAISFKAKLASKADLAMALRTRSEVPQQSRLLLRDADNLWVSWEDADKTLKDGNLCVNVVKPGAQGFGNITVG